MGITTDYWQQLGMDGTTYGHLHVAQLTVAGSQKKLGPSLFTPCWRATETTSDWDMSLEYFSKWPRPKRNWHMRDTGNKSAGIVGFWMWTLTDFECRYRDYRHSTEGVWGDEEKEGKRRKLNNCFFFVQSLTLAPQFKSWTSLRNPPAALCSDLRIMAFTNIQQIKSLVHSLGLTLVVSRCSDINPRDFSSLNQLTHHQTVQWFTYV